MEAIIALSIFSFSSAKATKAAEETDCHLE
jgi:hypothetical protein